MTIYKDYKMHRIFFFLSLLISVSAYSQDSVDIRVSYLETSKVYVERKPSTCEMCLDISGDKYAFYSYWEALDQAVFDSVFSKGGNAYDAMGATEGHPMPHVRDFMFFNYAGDNQCLSQNSIFVKFLEFSEPIPTQEWTLLEADTTMLGYHCQAAECKFRGRTWRAYFTNEIPISLGPWKLRGLPGLILYAEDSTKNFRYSAIQVKRSPGLPLLKVRTGVIKSTREAYIALKKEYASDREGAQTKLLGINMRGNGRDRNGKVIVPPKYTAVLRELDL